VSNVQRVTVTGGSAGDRMDGHDGADSFTGNGGNDILIGRHGDDRLEGGAGDDELYGGVHRGTGVDWMDGGSGNDFASIYLDRVTAAVSFSTQAAASAGGLTLVDGTHVRNVERVYMMTGSGVDSILLNSGGGHTFSTGDGNDTLRFTASAAPAAHNIWDGGDGEDHLIADHSAATAAVNAVYSNFGSSFAVNIGGHAALLVSNVQRVTVTGGSAGDRMDGHDGADSFTGNGGNDDLRGNGGDDRLSGGNGRDSLFGGTGSDNMFGGAGNDSYVADHRSDRAVEGAGNGTDTVTSSVSFALGVNVERLILSGAGHIGGKGNGLANILTGNGGSNALDGRAGADRMQGGGGNDLYHVDNGDDRVLEATYGGTDSVVSSVTLTLAVNVEQLTLAGSSRVNGTGNALANEVTGNASNNMLAGLAAADVLDGGAGNDTLRGGAAIDALTGGTGVDRFCFDTRLGVDNVDRITDFLAADDVIELDRTVFAGIAVDGRLGAAAFHVGARAADAVDRIVYDQATGRIFYDADGSGAAAAVLFARVEAGTVLTNADFYAIG
jgi:Ca2+-binding RTX toxin-like protein